MKQSVSFLKARKSLLEQKIAAFQKTAEFAEYQRWRALSQEEQRKLREAWNEYYRRCRSSFWGKAFQFLSEKMKNGESVRLWVEKIKRKAENGGATGRVSQPSAIDPEEVERKMSSYHSLCNELARVSAMMEEERKKERSETLE